MLLETVITVALFYLCFSYVAISYAPSIKWRKREGSAPPYRPTKAIFRLSLMTHKYTFNNLFLRAERMRFERLMSKKRI